MLDDDTTPTTDTSDNTGTPVASVPPKRVRVSALAKELGPHGIRPNAIAPGIIDTPFHEVFTTPEMMTNFLKMIPLGRMGTSMECATVIAFLASDASSYIVGETIEINGGLLMR